MLDQIDDTLAAIHRISKGMLKPLRMRILSDPQFQAKSKSSSHHMTHTRFVARTTCHAMPTARSSTVLF